MPRYGGYGYMPQMGGGQDANPFFDPYSATPDYGAGIAAMIKNLWQMDALKKQQEAASSQQAFENKMSSADYDYKRAQTDVLRQKVGPTAPDLSSEAQTIQYLIGLGIPQADAVNMVMKVKEEAPLEMLPGMETSFHGLTPDAWKKIPRATQEKLTGEHLIRTRPDKTTTPPKANPKLKSLDSYAAGLEKTYVGAVTNIEKAAKGSESARMMAGLLGKEQAPDTSSADIDNLNAGLAEIRRIRGVIANGEEPSADDKILLQRLGTDMAKIKKVGLSSGAQAEAPVVDEIDSDPEFQAFVKAHPEEPKGKVRAMFRRYRSSQKR
jgi:hypothetical protein